MDTHVFEQVEADFVNNLSSSLFTCNPTPRTTLVMFIKSVLSNPSPENYSRCTDNLTGVDLMGILNVIYHQKASFHFQHSQDSLLDASVVFICMRRLIKKWDGFPRYFIFNPNINMIIKNLIKYLTLNLRYINHKKKMFFQELEKNEDEVIPSSDNTLAPGCESVVLLEQNTDTQVPNNNLIVECPYNKLKTLFFMDITKQDTTILNKHKEIKSQNNFQLSDFNYDSLFNWSFVEITFNTPKYAITYKNTHHLHHTLVKFQQNYKPLRVSNELPKVTSKSLSDNCETVIPHEFFKYLSGLDKSGIAANVPIIKKSITCINRILKRIGSICKTSTLYTISSRRSYYRLLGQTCKNKYDGPVVSYKKQKNITSDDDLNVRLQEVIQPQVQVRIDRHVPDLDGNRISIHISCILCDVKFTDARSDFNMKQHLIFTHGQEPDWFCMDCDENFTMKKITSSYWLHLCRRKPNDTNSTF